MNDGSRWQMQNCKKCSPRQQNFEQIIEITKIFCALMNGKQWTGRCEEQIIIITYLSIGNSVNGANSLD